MITAYVQSGQSTDALQFFNQMQQEGVAPNKFIFVSTLSACAGQAALSEGKWMHARIMCSGFELDNVMGNALLNMYGKCSSLDDARNIFHRMPHDDVRLWNALIAAYAQNGLAKEALQLFEQMQWEAVSPNKVTFISVVTACASQGVVTHGKWVHAHIMCSGFSLDAVVVNALIDMYAKCRHLEDAWDTFEKMPQRDVISWNALIVGYSQNGESKISFQLFDRMLDEGVLPDKVTFISVLNACASQTMLPRGKQMCVYMTAHRFKFDVPVVNAIITMYGKCGRPKDARRMFDIMPEKTMGSWNTMLSTYAQSGEGKDGLQLVGKMQQEGLVPDKITFMSTLSACSRAGLVDEGYDYFFSMHKLHAIALHVDHCNCMIDILGKAGRLNDAEELANSMPFQPTMFSWTALLTACRNQVDVKRAARAAKHAFELDLEDASPYITLSNIFSA